MGPTEASRYDAEASRLARLPEGVGYVRRGTRHEYRQGRKWISFERLDDTSSGLLAWVEIGEARKRLTSARYDLMGPRTVPSLLKEVGNGWDELVQEARYDVIARRLEGAPLLNLADEAASVDTGPLLRPLIAGVGSSLLVGLGGIGKSWLALAAAGAVASGSHAWLGVTPARAGAVIYLDWEASHEDHHTRLRALAAGVGQPTPRNIGYLPMSGPLSRQTEAVRRHVDDLGAQLIIVDSVMLARSGDAFGPETTNALHAALREIGTPALLLDHKSRDAARTGRTGAYGSVVGENTARLMWEVRARVDDPHGFTLRLEQTKNNGARRVDPIAYSFVFGGEENRRFSARIRPSDRVPDPEAPVDAHLADRISALLATTEGLTVAELADALGCSDAAVKARLNEHRDRFENVAPRGQPGRWRLRPRELPNAF